MRMERWITTGMITIILAGFQNCSEVNFERQAVKSPLESASIASYTTDEDTPMSADLIRDRATLGAVTGTVSAYSLTKQSSHGQVTFREGDATFTYIPDPDFFGEDSFEIAEIPDGASQAIPRTIAILVRSVNDLPTIKTDFLSYDMNSKDNVVILELADKDDPDVWVSLSNDDGLTSKLTSNGRLEKKNGQILYSPNIAFRGVEQVDFWAMDTRKGLSQKQIAINVGNPFRDFQPALAIRGAGCVACHANVRSPFVTDAGFGNTWFAGQNGPISHAIATRVLGFASGNMYGDHGDNWKTAVIAGPIVVPKTSELFIGGKTQTLGAYYLGLEAAKSSPSSVVEKTNVYIGAPTAMQLEERFRVGSAVKIKYLANDVASPNLSGIVDKVEYWANQGPLVCDGDLFLRGTVFLNNPVVHTSNGCRIHATGSIFIQGNPTYVNLGSSRASNNTNLQLVSSRAVILGVGLAHCETGTQWYALHNAPNPLKMRIQDIWTANSHVTRSSSYPRLDGEIILAEAAKLQGYVDASCYSSGRNVHLERILINAPMVQSRLTGNVSGVVISEAALFALNQFSYEFDQVFKRVPVLPLLREGDFLEIK